MGEERKQHDEERLSEVAVVAGVSKEEFRRCLVRVRRLGKREEGKTYRPVLVRLSSQDVRERLLRGNRQLRDANRENNTRHRIDPDLTKEQMLKLDEMWNLARKKSESKNGLRFFVVGKENPEIRSQRVEEEEPDIKERRESFKSVEES